MTLAEFLLARIAEDEDLVGAEPDPAERRDMGIDWAEVGAISEVLLIGEARLRAECAAKRRIAQGAINLDTQIETIDPLGMGHWAEAHTLDDVMGILATVYADHRTTGNGHDRRPGHGARWNERPAR